MLSGWGIDRGRRPKVIAAEISKTTPREACEPTHVPLPTTPTHPIFARWSPWPTARVRRDCTAVATHADAARATVAARVRTTHAAVAAAWHEGARPFSLLSACCFAAATPAALSRSDAVGAAGSGLCFGVRALSRHPFTGWSCARLHTTSPKVRSRASLNSPTCASVLTYPLVRAVADSSLRCDLRMHTGAAGALCKGHYRVRHFAGVFASLVISKHAREDPIFVVNRPF